MKEIKPRTIIALVLLYIALFFDWQWIWGILFLFWVIPDIRNEHTYFIEPISKKANPVLYWIIIVSWIGLAIYSFSSVF